MTEQDKTRIEIAARNYAVHQYQPKDHTLVGATTTGFYQGVVYALEAVDDVLSLELWFNQEKRAQFCKDVIDGILINMAAQNEKEKDNQ